MVVGYNALNRLETPTLTLCNPGSIYTSGYNTKIVGILNNTEAIEVVINFNALSDLNFRINDVTHEDPTTDSQFKYLYKNTQNRRLIFAQDLGYFVINEVTDGYADGLRYKDVRAQSVEAEISQKNIPFIPNGTYKFFNDVLGEQRGIIHRVVETLPHWTIGNVDSVIKNKYRTFEDVDTSLNCLGFLMDNVQDAYECIITFDIINRIINVYDREAYVNRTNIHLTKDDFIKTMDIVENASDVYTALTVMGEEEVLISSVNPLGSNTIYDFTYYLGWMSAGLSSKVSAWQTNINNVSTDYANKNALYYQYLTELNTLELQLQNLNAQLDLYKRCRENVVAETSTNKVASFNTALAKVGGTQVNIEAQVSQVLAELDSLIASTTTSKNNTVTAMNSKSSQLVSTRVQIEAIRNQVAFDTVFTVAELEELTNYIYEGSYTDPYVKITEKMTQTEQFDQMKVLYSRAKEQIKKISQPSQQFNLGVENFIYIKDFESWASQLETGTLVNIELDTDDVAALFLSNMTINYEDYSLSMTFGNRFNKYDPKSLFDNVLGNISKTANTLEYVKQLLYPIKSGKFSEMENAIQTVRDLTMGNVLASENEDVVIDATGYTGREILPNGEFDPHQIKITSNNIVFTDDAWQTCKTAIGMLQLGDGVTTYGVNAQTLIGDMIIGNQLRILDSEGRNLFTVVDGLIETSVTKQQIIDDPEIRAALKGDKGEQGIQGIQGVKGSDGQTFYTWIKYADTPTTGMSDTPDGKTYIGIAYNKTTATESDSYGDYTWSLIKGADGIAGAKGADGQTLYTWVKYADTDTGTGMSDSPEGKRYLGLAHNKTTPTESGTATDYTWSPLYDNVKVGGRNLLRDSGTPVTNNSYNIKIYPLSVPIETGKEYTVSIKGQLGAGKSSFALYNSGETIQEITVADSDKGSDGIYRKTFTAISATRTNISIYVYTISSSVIVDSTIEWIKLEAGNIATDWTPAPEDVEDRFYQAETRITQTEDNITLYAGAISGLENRVENAEIALYPTEIVKTIKASEVYTTDIQGIKDTMSTMVETIDGFNADYSSRFDGIDGQIQQYNSYLSWNAPSATLTIGDSKSPTKLIAAPNGIKINEGSTSIAEFIAGQMIIEDAIVKKDLYFANHKAQKHDSEITLLLWTGGKY